MRCSVDGYVATITLCRPDKLNILSRAALDELGGALDWVEAAPEIRAVIVTGEGEKAFAAGGDLSEFVEITAPEMVTLSRHAHAIFRRLETMGIPFIAAVNGIALGAGLELALACSIRILAENVRVGLPELRLGVIPGYGGTQRLTRLIGMGRALELMLTGNAMDAHRAYEVGLANKVVPLQDLMPTCRELAAQMAGHGPVAVRMLLDVVQRGLQMGLEDGCFLESSALATIFSSEDRNEGIRAFQEKRRPHFKGR